jgi:hypothetical protein
MLLVVVVAAPVGLIACAQSPKSNEEPVLIVRLPEVLWQEFASVAVMVKVDAPAVVGVPVMAPVLVFRLKPAGREPLATD